MRAKDFWQTEIADENECENGTSQGVQISRKMIVKNHLKQKSFESQDACRQKEGRPRTRSRGKKITFAQRRTKNRSDNLPANGKRGSGANWELW